MAPATPEDPAPPSAGQRMVDGLDDPSLYINRELSWLEFNRRVLEEALDPRNPLLERVKFLSIFGNNLDEFFMIRVSGLRRQRASGVVETPPDRMTPAQQLAAIREHLLPLLEQCVQCWSDDLLPQLESSGIHIRSYEELEQVQRDRLRSHFEREIFPILTPLAFDPGHPFPHISNLSMNLAVVIHDPEHGQRFARLKVPQSLPRLLRVPEAADGSERLGLVNSQEIQYVWIEQVILENLDLMFPGLEVRDAFTFRITRDADLEIEEDEAADLLTAMAEVVEQRRFGSAVRLQFEEKMPARIREILMDNLGLAPYQVYTGQAPLGLRDLSELCGLDRPELKYPSFHPVLHPSLPPEENLFQTLRSNDVVLYHPYDSFYTVVGFLKQAARDPDVVAIKQTLYRVGQNSPIVEALMEARENEKQVAALVELKARFDEENNIGWARALEQAGVHVVYGILGLKTHAKMALVVRRERDGIRHYVHLSSGNYNPITGRIYTDLGFFTCDADIARDVSDLFNALTGYSRKATYRKLLVAPGQMRKQLIERIDREIERHRDAGDGLIAFKMNALVDEECIKALYRASRAGVKIDLQVRGICCLRPGVPGVSDNIHVTSIVGRFLEHTRIFYFRNGGNDEVLLGSADLMPRNLDNRVEALFPIEHSPLRDAIREDILFLHLQDSAKARELLPGGQWQRVQPASGTEPLDTQAHILERGGCWRQHEP